MKDRKLTRSIVEISIKLMLILLMAVASMSSFGWFSSKRDLDHRNLAMSIRSDDAIASYKLYRFDVDDTNRGILVCEKTISDDETDDVLSIDMNEYDTIFTKRNRYTPAFIRIELTKLDATPVEGTVNVTLTKKDFNTVTVDGKEYDCISQVVRFSAVVDHDFEDGHTFSESLGIAPISPAEIDAMADDNDDPFLSTKHHLFYMYVDEKLYSGMKHACYRDGKTIIPKIDSSVVSEDSDIFYTALTAQTDELGEVTGYDMTEKDTITLSASYTEEDWTTVTTDDGEQDVLNIYIYLTYDDGLLECYKTMNDMMSSVSLLEDRIQFKNNLDHIKISFGTGGGSN